MAFEQVILIIRVEITFCVKLLCGIFFANSQLCFSSKNFGYDICFLQVLTFCPLVRLGDHNLVFILHIFIVLVSLWIFDFYVASLKQLKSTENVKMLNVNIVAEQAL